MDDVALIHIRKRGRQRHVVPMDDLRDLSLAAEARSGAELSPKD